MFQKVEVPVLGIVENMSSFVCGECGAQHAIFGSGGGAAYARELGIPLLGAIPLEAVIAEAGDAGEPAVARSELSAAGKALVETARATAGQISVRAASGGGGSFAHELPIVR